MSLPLYSSADHAFVINRGDYHGKRGTTTTSTTGSSPDAALTYSFRGDVDEGISWESVKLVKYQGGMDVQTCPVCLDSFTCARITKCGHAFCLTCLIRHIHSSADQYQKNNGVKCPCCGSTNLFLTDCRPVEFVTITPPRIDAPITGGSKKKNHKNSTTMRFVKLHRYKGSSSPFLPRISEPRRAAPHALPLQSDHDAPFSRINYMDPQYIRTLLTTHLADLRKMPREDDMFEICRSLAIEFVENELKTALQEAPTESEMQQRFSEPSAGVYQRHHPQFILEQPPPSLEPTVTGGDMIFSIDEEQEGTVSASSPQYMEQRPRSSSVNSEHSSGAGRHRSASLGSETSYDSNASNGSESPKQQQKSARHPNHNNKHKTWTPGSIYLGSDESLFYQSEDGQLCFLCGFNMQCLRAEFSATHPALLNEEHGTTQQHKRQQQIPSRRREPLPDIIQGRVFEIEHITITRQNRHKMRFLSHLPVGTSITLVEIGMGGVLNHQTKKVFSKEFQKRRNARDRKQKAEKRADERAQKREEQRIEQVRAQMPLVNRNFRSDAIDINSDEFGPSLSASSPHPTARNAAATATRDPGVVAPSVIARPAPSEASFSSIARKASQDSNRPLAQDDFPALGSASAFPALGSSPPSRKSPPKKWNTSKLVSSSTAKKGKKPVLISTLTELGPGT